MSATNSTNSINPPNPTNLILNHMDAWGVSFIVASSALLIHQAITVQTSLLLLAITLGYWFAFAVNDYYDAPFDALDPAKAHRNFFVHYSPVKRMLMLTVATVLVFLLGVFAQFALVGLITLVVCLFMVWAYSAPPLRFKNRPGADLLIHALFVETFPYLTLFV